ncbi:Heavy-chain fibroin [Leptospirillum ferriphilum]|uniref:Heavy-chain fibroin n=1 Tax=Leptospirillum ferriphilum TaxID=178606 RepID=A0A094YKS6_9BACT|nr:Heavy-chain fibroin [Leptospirillum ferriphilum]
MRGFHFFKLSFFSFFLLFGGCGGGGGGAGGASAGCSPCPSGTNGAYSYYANTIPVYMGYFNGALQVNVPYVTVRICIPSTTQCQTINNVLLDTASSGLRIFSDALTISLPNVQVGGQDVATCESFGSGNIWGGMYFADVYLAGEPSFKLAVHVGSSSFGLSGTPPSPCNSSLVSSATQAGMNGILGIGPVPEGYVTSFYACNGSSCSSLNSSQGQDLTSENGYIRNPLFALASETDSGDINGVTIQLNAVPSGGLNYSQTNGSPGMVVGKLILGVNGQSDNPTPQPTASTLYGIYDCTCSNGFILTGLFGSSLGTNNTIDETLFDTGTTYADYAYSNVNTWTPPTTCSVSGYGSLDNLTWYCPSSDTPYTYDVIYNQDGNAPDYFYSLVFHIGNASTLLSNASNNAGVAFNNLAYEYTGSSNFMDLGVEVYFGHDVQILYPGTPLSTNDKYPWNQATFIASDSTNGLIVYN